MFLSILPSACDKEDPEDLSACFAGREGTIVIYDEYADRYFVHNPQRSEQRFSPFSTFKIPNSLIALETGVVHGIEDTLFWNRSRYPAEDWWPAVWKTPQTLPEAFQNSTVPLYRQIARDVGEAQMQKYLNQFSYGNMDISSGLDDFWLNGSLQISAVEQIRFLRSLCDKRLGISRQTGDLMVEVMVLEKKTNYTLSAKTGGGYLDAKQEQALGWYVGYVDKYDRRYYFALNVDGDSFEAVRKSRVSIAKCALRKLNILPRPKKD